MLKWLTICGFGAWGEVNKVKQGFDVAITIPFGTKESAEDFLSKLVEAKEVVLVEKDIKPKGS